MGTWGPGTPYQVIYFGVSLDREVPLGCVLQEHGGTEVFEAGGTICPSTGQWGCGGRSSHSSQHQAGFSKVLFGSGGEGSPGSETDN